ncbi:uncharacterized protein LOC123722360 [Papilio machaon]|uniref:uncharacterized protein LOC123722360 n=1 Tax=Papilio machaon TaxID=76193 RepID=UPI001E665F9F|nr:uncharacterized protein LOC123722360 [Papilio machaon]
MLLFRLSCTVLILLVFKLLDLRCQRRISNGHRLEKLKNYLVYFVHSDKSTTSYDGWTCAGTLVHSLFIVTAAACLEDVPNLYAMAGYAKLVPYSRIDVDKCTSRKQTQKKKVIYTCVPKSYELDYANVEKWSAIDIGIAKVETRFIQHAEYEKFCTVKPLRLPVNFNHAYQSPGIDAIVMGWGHLETWRKPGDQTNYNQERPRYASVRIMNKKECKEYYKDFPELQKNIDKYMICTMEKGNVNAAGVTNWSHIDFKDQCTGDDQNCRRNFKESHHWNISSVNGRRQGICQNDHGAPLVTWIGGKEHLIGVASVFRVNQEGKCAGPYLFTSTQCNGVFLECVLGEYLYKNSGDKRRRSICNSPARERGFEMIHRHINWINNTYIKRKSRKERRQKFKQVTKHNIQRTTKKSFLNEKIRIRPQISIRNLTEIKKL